VITSLLQSLPKPKSRQWIPHLSQILQILSKGQELKINHCNEHMLQKGPQAAHAPLICQKIFEIDSEI
jgi:hypothetical protein